MKRLTFLIGLFLILSTFCTENLIAASIEMDTIKPIPEKRRPNLPEPEPEDNALYQVIGEMPRFPGCENLEGEGKKAVCANKKFEEFIAQNLQYPEVANKNGIEGTVVATFVVEKNGRITNPEIIKSLSESCDKEVLRLIEEMPKWIPGKQKGDIKRVQIVFVVEFDLKEWKEKEKARKKAAKTNN
jgi:TonB family protein